MLCETYDGDEEMIVVDIETSGPDIGQVDKIGIWQIGALIFEKPKLTFLQEGRIDDADIIDDITGSKTVYEVTGKTEAQLRDKKKQSQKQLLNNFFQWCKDNNQRVAICQNPIFDLGFLNYKARRYGLDYPLHYRSFDLHSVASQKYLQVNGKLLIADGHSDMGLGNILHFCGMKDTRMKMEKGQVIRKGVPHNALEDAKLTAECFSRILYGKNIFKEYKKFPIPKHLRK